MKFFTFKSSVFVSIVLSLTFAMSLISVALTAGSIQITTKGSNFPAFFSEEVKIPFEVETAESIGRITLEATSAQKEIVPKKIENLSITTSCSSIKANPITINSTNRKFSGIICAKISDDFMANNSTGSTTITLTAKTAKNQIANLQLNVVFKKRSLAYSKDAAIVSIPNRDSSGNTAVIGYVYPTERFFQGLSAADFEMVNNSKSVTSSFTTPIKIRATPTPTPTDTSSTTGTTRLYTSTTDSSGTFAESIESDKSSSSSSMTSFIFVMLSVVVSYISYFFNRL